MRAAAEAERLAKEPNSEIVLEEEKIVIESTEHGIANPKTRYLMQRFENILTIHENKRIQQEMPFLTDRLKMIKTQHTSKNQ